MNNDNVLLTRKEIEEELNKRDDWLSKQGQLYCEGKIDIRPYIYPEEWTDKAQCIKLLKWLDTSCTSHRSKRVRIGLSGHMQRKDCLYCKMWLDKLLKDGK